MNKGPNNKPEITREELFERYIASIGNFHRELEKHVQQLFQKAEKKKDYNTFVQCKLALGILAFLERKWDVVIALALQKPYYTEANIMLRQVIELYVIVGVILSYEEGLIKYFPAIWIAQYEKQTGKNHPMDEGGDPYWTTIMQEMRSLSKIKEEEPLLAKSIQAYIGKGEIEGFITLLTERSKYYIKQAKLENIIREHTQESHFNILQFSSLMDSNGKNPTEEGKTIFGVALFASLILMMVAELFKFEHDEDLLRNYSMALQADKEFFK